MIKKQIKTIFMLYSLIFSFCSYSNDLRVTDLENKQIDQSTQLTHEDLLSKLPKEEQEMLKKKLDMMREKQELSNKILEELDRENY